MTTTSPACGHPPGCPHRWTDEHLTKLVEHAGKLTWQEIADMFGKTERAVRTRAQRMGIIGRPRGKRTNPAQYAMFEELHAAKRESWRSDVVLTTPCIEWIGARDKDGYGWTSAHKRAHRVAWAEAHGQTLPESLLVLHHCDNPPCVNPEHLFLGTAADNNRDRVSKGHDWNIPKTHCPLGHPLDGRTVRGRYCKTCHAANMRALRKAKREADSYDDAG